MQVHGPAPDLRVVLLTTVLVLILDLGVAMFFVQDLYRPDRRVRGGDKQFWLVVILLGSVLGWIAYLFYGREE